MNNRSQSGILAFLLANPDLSLYAEKQKLMEEAQEKAAVLKKLVEQLTTLETPRDKQEVCSEWYVSTQVNRFDEENINSLTVTQLQSGITILNDAIDELTLTLLEFPEKVTEFKLLQKQHFNALRVRPKNIENHLSDNYTRSLKRRLLEIEEECEIIVDFNIIAYSILVDEYETCVTSLEKTTKHLESQAFLRETKKLLDERDNLIAEMRKDNIPTNESVREIKSFINNFEESTRLLSGTSMRRLRNSFKNTLTEDYKNMLKLRLDESIKIAKNLIDQNTTLQKTRYFCETYELLLGETKKILGENPDRETLDRYVKGWNTHISELRQNAQQLTFKK